MKEKAFLFAIAALVIFFLAHMAQAPQVLQGGEWPMFRHDLLHSGATDNAVVPPLELAWKYKTEGLIVSSPAISGGVVYVSSYDGKVYALDAADGALKWKHPVGSRLFSSPAVSDGTVYVGSDDNNVYALDAVTGALKWKYATSRVVQSSPAAWNGAVYASSMDGSVYALNAAAGTLKWKYPTGGFIYSSPAILGGMVYIGSEDGSVYALDAASGMLNWKYTLGSPVESLAISGGVLYMGAGDGNVYALDIETRTLKWKYTTGGMVQSSPAVFEGMVYVGSADNSVYALDASTGTVKWKYATGGKVYSSPSVSGGTVYANSDDSNVYALHAATGALRWKYTTGRSAGSAVYSSPAISGGMLYFGSLDGSVYAFAPVSGSGTGNAATSEPHDNIVMAESVKRSLMANQYVTYTFSPSEHGIYEILVKAKENENDVTIRVEALKEKSKYAASSAPGAVYANMNIVAATQNIREALIRFRVENSWIESKDAGYYSVRMVRWDGSRWAKLETAKKTKDSTYSYYEAKLCCFSPFAITGIREEAQAATKPSQTSKSEGQNNWLLFIVLILLTAIAVRRLRKNKKIVPPAIVLPKLPEKKPEKDNHKDIHITSAFGYKGATILYKVRIENASSAPIADIRVFLFVPSVFLLLEKEKALALLKSGESQTVTFEIRPTGECGDCEVSGKVTYYDTGSNRTEEVDIDTKMLSIVCPMLKVKEISEPEWHNAVSNLIETEENTKEIEMPAETLFNMASRIIKDMHMHMLAPEVTQSQQLFNGVARFFGEGVKGLRYAALVEVVGGARKAKLILKAWAEKEDALTGFYHGILDEIEKRINVKGYIDEPIVQHFNIAGHYVTGQVGKIIDVGDRSVQDGKG